MSKQLILIVTTLRCSQCSESSTPVNAESLSEIEGDTLHVYGSRSLDAFDRSWGFQAAGCVTAVHFHYIDFDDIAKILAKIRVRFPNVVVSLSLVAVDQWRSKAVRGPGST